MRRFLFFLLGVWVLGFSGACSSQIVNVPINPYVDPDLQHQKIRRVAVLPFIIPEYLHYQEGAEAVSIEVTNSFIAELAALRLYSIADGDVVRSAIKRQFANPRDWIFQGTAHEAARIGMEVRADAVVFGVIKKYFQGNLTDSEFEIEINLVEVTSRLTVWRVREVLIGKGGKKYLNETPFSIPPARLAEVAAKDAVKKIRKIHEVGGPIEVVNVSYRKACGYGVLAGGFVLTAVGSYYYNEASVSYSRYKDADNETDLEKYRRQTKEYDQAWQILGGLGVAAIGGGLYLIFTDHTVEARTSSTGGALARRSLVVLPAVLGPETPGVVVGLRF